MIAKLILGTRSLGSRNPSGWVALLALLLFASGSVPAHLPDGLPVVQAKSLLNHLFPDHEYSVGSASDSDLALVESNDKVALIFTGELLSEMPESILVILDAEEFANPLSPEAFHQLMVDTHREAHRLIMVAAKEDILMNTGNMPDYDPLADPMVAHLAEHLIVENGTLFGPTEESVLQVFGEGGQVRLVPHKGFEAVLSLDRLQRIHQVANSFTWGLAQDSISLGSIDGGWTSVALGGGRPGNVQPNGSKMSITAFGEDVWYAYDQCQFVFRTAPGDFDLSADVDSIAQTEEWTKGGLMVRASLAPDAPMAILGRFSSGSPEWAYRESKSIELYGVSNDVLVAGGTNLRVVREGERLIPTVELAQGETVTLDHLDISEWPDTLHVGFFLVSHHNDLSSTMELSSIEWSGETTSPSPEFLFNQPAWRYFLNALHEGEHE